MKDFVEEHLDLLQNIEFAIVDVYRKDSGLLDYDAKDAIEALARHYHAEEGGRTPPERQLGERAERVFQSVQAVCEFRLGRTGHSDTGAPKDAVSLEVLVKALREILKSIPRWTQRGGRRGYLDFASQYVP